ncbi:MAG: hypothetical protein HY033_11050 [Ignavibacteriae bacterium]|nr:hypothetical protein [Ignavibacteriota bacterium]
MSANDPPDPLTTLHPPVPTDGVFPARVTVVNPQVAAPVWSGPAFAVVGVPLIERLLPLSSPVPAGLSLTTRMR